MKRRDFFVGIGAAALGLARPVAAQQPGALRRLGVFMGYRESDKEAQARLTAFFQVFEELGWRDGRNLRVEYRWAAGSADQIRSSASELIAGNPDVILAATTPVVRALLQETRTVPVVFISVSDPVGDGFVNSLSRPSGNATGFTNLERSLSGKWLELVKELAPSVTHVAALFNPATSAGRGAYYWPPFEAAASWSSVQALQAPVQNENDIERHITELASKPNSGGGLAVMPDVFTVVNRARIHSARRIETASRCVPIPVFRPGGRAHGIWH